MPYAYEQDVPIGPEIYDKIMQRLGKEPLAGCLVHLVIRTGEKSLRYVDVWESKEACERAFAERIHPAVYETFREIGFRPDGEPVKRELALVEAYRRAT